MKRKLELKVEEYVLSPEGRQIPLDRLPPEEYARFCRWLSRAWLGTLFSDRVELLEEEEE